MTLKVKSEGIFGEIQSTPFTPKVKSIRYTAGKLRMASTTFATLLDAASVSVGAALDLTLPSGSVAVGDTIEIGGNVGWANNALDGYLTFGTIVATAVVNTCVGGNGILGLWGAPSVYCNASGSGFYVVQSGDLSSGALTVRPLGKGSTTSVKEILGGGSDASIFWLKNWGPQ